MRVMLAVLACTVILWTLARLCYVTMLAGVPDSGLLPTPALPGALWEYISGVRLVLTASGFITWFVGMAVFLVPPFVGVCIARNVITRFGIVIYCMCVAIVAWLLIQQGLGEYRRLTAHHLEVWIVALSFLGWLGGLAAHVILSRRKKNAQAAAHEPA